MIATLIFLVVIVGIYISRLHGTIRLKSQRNEEITNNNIQLLEEVHMLEEKVKAYEKE